MNTAASSKIGRKTEIWAGRPRDIGKVREPRAKAAAKAVERDSTSSEPYSPLGDPSEFAYQSKPPVANPQPWPSNTIPITAGPSSSPYWQASANRAPQLPPSFTSYGHSSLLDPPTASFAYRQLPSPDFRRDTYNENDADIPEEGRNPKRPRLSTPSIRERIETLPPRHFPPIQPPTELPSHHPTSGHAAHTLFALGRGVSAVPNLFRNRIEQTWQTPQGFLGLPPIQPAHPFPNPLESADLPVPTSTQFQDSSERG